jgi:LETM1 and EF-hand domain-containing protein 1
MPTGARLAMASSRRLLSGPAAAAARDGGRINFLHLGHHWRPLSNASGAHLQVALLVPGALPSPGAAVCSCLAGLRGALSFRHQAREFHLSPLSAAEPSSKIEETVEQLKKKQQQKTDPGTARRGGSTLLDHMEEYTRGKSLQMEVQAVIERSQSKERERQEKEEEQKQLAEKQEKKSIWGRFVEEVKHYYSGFKLLFLDIRICSKIVWKVARGNVLTRREKRQLVRTVSDLFRLVPFSVFIIVPFMEFLLPVALKLFPGMLPSTFTTRSEQESKMRRTLKAKLEYAKFLQETLDEMGPRSSSSRRSNSAKDFVDFYNRVKDEGLAITNEEIAKFSPLFEDEITLDNMSRSQLIALCRLLEISPIGTNNLLRFQLEMRVRQLKIDDRVIYKEGVDNLDVTELQAACRERGMKAYGLTAQALKLQLDQWLDLSLNYNIPPTLLLMSRTLFLPEETDVTQQIAATISSLPESAAKQTSAQIGEREGKVRNVTQLEIIKEEQRKIEEEEKERKEAVESGQPHISTEQEFEQVRARLRDDVKSLVRDDARGLKNLVREARGQVKRATVSQTGELQEDLAGGGGGTSVDLLQESKGSILAAQEDLEISFSDLSTIRDAIDSLQRSDDTERDGIDELKKELMDYEEDLEELQFVRAEAGRFDLHESKGARRLFSRVNKMLSKVNQLQEKLEEKEKAIEKQLRDADASEEEKSRVEENLVSVHELTSAIAKLTDSSDSSKVEHIAEVRIVESLFALPGNNTTCMQVLGRMDTDADGVIKVDQVMRVIALLGEQHGDLNPRQVNQIVDMLQKEEMMEIEGHLEKVLVKEPPGKEADKDAGEAAKKDSSSSSSDSSSSDNDESAAAGRPFKEGETLRDTAKDLTEQQPEEHIREMFEETPRRSVMKASGDHEGGSRGGGGGGSGSKPVSKATPPSESPPPIDLK